MTTDTAQVDRAADGHGRAIGSLIAAGFGLTYVIVNSAMLAGSGGAGSVFRWVVVVAAVLAALLIAIRAMRLLARAGRPSGGRSPFGRAFVLLTVVEVLAIFVGVRFVAGVLGRPDLGVVWVTLVVGLHFFVLARLFGVRAFHLLGALLVTCAVLGWVLDLLTVPAGSALAGGVAAGAVLLAFGFWGVRR
ncbi:hypothetical protein ACF3NT_02540 [Naumannella halotolerans]|uniref:Uncharacterized protein n=1 Tax=Naumannella halotolerans TaxID=993414 RepID=A0A4R7J8Y0_9ACTN|nr:hypothetical protein [Naumannella halotolerans]TDT32943.1 hypothetical protein CLV29_0534 [Naumannella halotolerans]